MKALELAEGVWEQLDLAHPDLSLEDPIRVSPIADAAEFGVVDETDGTRFEVRVSRVVPRFLKD